MNLYERVSLVKDISKYGLKSGDVATLVEFVDNPVEGEKGCVLEFTNALGETINVISLPISSIEPLKSDEILSVRYYSKAI